MNARALIVGFYAFLISALSVAAETSVSPPIPGPAAGVMFPVPISAPDQTGSVRTLQSLMGSKGVALFFVRSADWCPFCQHQLADANAHLEKFKALGLNVASISVDTPDLIAPFAKSQNIGYPMLADPKGDINLKLGIRDEHYPTGSKEFGVPRPTLYLIDRKGIIRARYMEPTYRTRPDLDRVIVEASAIQW